jgi:hypothetical protein
MTFDAGRVTHNVRMVADIHLQPDTRQIFSMVTDMYPSPVLAGY